MKYEGLEMKSLESLEYLRSRACTHTSQLLKLQVTAHPVLESVGTIISTPRPPPPQHSHMILLMLSLPKRCTLTAAPITAVETKAPPAVQ